MSEYQAYEGVCPNCGVIWGMDEVDHEYCASCGYNDDTILDDDYEDDMSEPITPAPTGNG